MSFPDRDAVLAFLEKNPALTTKRDIAKGLKVKGRERQRLRDVLKALEEEGALQRVAKREWVQPDSPPPVGMVLFDHLDRDGELIGQVVGKEGPFGPPIRFDGFSKGRRGTPPGVGGRALCKIRRTPSGWVGHAIKVMDGDRDAPIVGVLEEGPRGAVLKPASRKEKRVLHIKSEDAEGAGPGALVSVSPLPGKPHGPAFGKVTEVFGAVSDPRAASLLAIHAHDIPTQFPEAVLEQARTAEPAEVEREDLRDTALITIDPPDARDHDDAIYAEALEGGGWRVVVAIADVAAHVTPGSALDREAYKRGNSTYFPDRVVPMLPFELSADACSLKEGEDRSCLAVEMKFSAKGSKTGHRFLRGTMKSHGNVAYEEAQAAIDGHPSTPLAERLKVGVLEPLWGAYRALSAQRDKRSPLDLDLPERRVVFDDAGEITGIVTKERLDAHRLVEEFMIQANVCAAETLAAKGMPLIYRVHDQPADAKIAGLADGLKVVGLKWTVGERPTPQRFNKLLSQVDGTPDDAMVTMMVLRAQSRAVYDPDNIGHFGLNLKDYAHFTSPIRRYADLVVHRALIEAHGFGPDGFAEGGPGDLSEVAEHISMTERRSMAAERDAADRYLAFFLEDRVGAEMAGRISGVTRAGLFIELSETGADGFVPISGISDEYWRFDGAAALISADTGKRYEMGMPVSVRLEEVEPVTGSLLLSVLSEPRKPRKGQHDGGGDKRRDERGPPRGKSRRPVRANAKRSSKAARRKPGRRK